MLGCIALLIAAIHLHSRPALVASVLFAVVLAIVKMRSLASRR